MKARLVSFTPPSRCLGLFFFGFASCPSSSGEEPRARVPGYGSGANGVALEPGRATVAAGRGGLDPDNPFCLTVTNRTRVHRAATVGG